MPEPLVTSGELAEDVLRGAHHRSLWAVDERIPDQAEVEIRAFSEHNKPSCVVWNQSRPIFWKHALLAEEPLSVSKDSLPAKPLQTPMAVSRAS
jgi:hypothetical protein